MNIKRLIEEIEQALKEAEFVDEFDITPVEEPINDVPSESEVGLSKTEELDKKTKISRALDTLVAQINDFKDTAMFEISSLDDMDLINATDELFGAVEKVKATLYGETISPVENPPMALEEPSDDDMADEMPMEDEEPESEDDEDMEEVDFDAEAGLDLFGTEEDDEDASLQESISESNMSYCRFHNTLLDLQDCYYKIEDVENMSADEKSARERLIDLCVTIAEEADYYKSLG